MHKTVYILIVLISCTFADVAIVTKPPEEVRTYPGQHIALPCVVENLTETLSVRWQQIDNIDSYKVISDNRTVHIPRLENIGEDYSIIGNEMNFTLLFKIPDKIDFGSDFNVTKSYYCSLIKSDVYLLNIFAKSHVIIQRLKICGEITTTYIIGEILPKKCYNYPYPTIITTSQNGSVLPTYLDKTSHIMHTFNLTKEDHNATFVCELRRNETNELKSCLIGPITVNYKPEINITQKSLTEFHCTTEARPAVNVTHWIVEPSIPQDSFTTTNGFLRIIKPLKVKSGIKITCEAENDIGKGNKSLIITTVNNRDEEIGFDSTSVIIIVICILFCLVFAFLIILLFLRNKIHQQTSKSRNTSARFRSAGPQVELKNEDPKRLVHDYATIDVNEFRADYQETENEIYVGGDMLGSDESNVANMKQSNTSNIAQPKNEPHVYSQVNKSDYKECENEIYQGPE